MSLDDDQAKEIRSMCDFLYAEDGTLIERAVLAEMYDYYSMADEVATVYFSITDGRMSKPNYFARDVLSEHEAVLENILRETQHEAAAQVLALLEQGATADQILTKEFPAP